ncbi:hypothetical protein B0H19DRAFT_1084089 [Mycena capillaripes]|nr:hypothetical protein B0H19DRAFT_1084089 [Mycena capillaripes]
MHRGMATLKLGARLALISLRPDQWDLFKNSIDIFKFLFHTAPNLSPQLRAHPSPQRDLQILAKVGHLAPPSKQPAVAYRHARCQRRCKMPAGWGRSLLGNRGSRQSRWGSMEFENTDLVVLLDELRDAIRGSLLRILASSTTGARNPSVPVSSRDARDPPVGSRSGHTANRGIMSRLAGAFERRLSVRSRTRRHGARQPRMISYKDGHLIAKQLSYHPSKSEFGPVYETNRCIYLTSFWPSSLNVLEAGVAHRMVIWTVHGVGQICMNIWFAHAFVKESEHPNDLNTTAMEANSRAKLRSLVLGSLYNEGDDLCDIPETFVHWLGSKASAFDPGHLLELNVNQT